MSSKNLKRVSAEEFNKWYDDKRPCALKASPKWNKKDCSVSWEWLKGGVACMFTDVGGSVEYYICED